jgi:hypothetical protein
MSASKGWRVLVFGIVLTILSASVSAQTKVYKWVDENGVVHFSEEPPIVAPEVKVEIITTSPARTPSPQVQTTVKPPARTKAKVESLTVQPDDEVPPLAKPVDIKKMSLEELGRRCEDAREAMIAPLRKAEIDKCVETGTGDQAWCRTHLMSEIVAGCTLGTIVSSACVAIADAAISKYFCPLLAVFGSLCFAFLMILRSALPSEAAARVESVQRSAGDPFRPVENLRHRLDSVPLSTSQN